MDSKPSPKVTNEYPGAQSTKFSAECDNVNLANGTELDVRVKGMVVGHIFLQDSGGALLLTGSRAPYIVRGTTVSINHHNGPAIVYGHF